MVQVLVESQGESGSYKGRNTQNKVVHFMPFDEKESNGELIGKTLDIKIYKAFPSTLRGERLTGLLDG